MIKELEALKELRQNLSKAEVILWDELKNKKGASKFRKKYTIGTFLVDYVCLAKNLIVERNFDDFGILLNETWKAKRELSKYVSSDRLDFIYNLGIKNGALGGKLLGAGGAGFFLFYLPRNKREAFLSSFKKFTCIPFKFEQEGSTIIFNDKRN